MHLALQFLSTMNVRFKRYSQASHAESWRSAGTRAPQQGTRTSESPVTAFLLKSKVHVPETWRNVKRNASHPWSRHSRKFFGLKFYHLHCRSLDLFSFLKSVISYHLQRLVKVWSTVKCNLAYTTGNHRCPQGLRSSTSPTGTHRVSNSLWLRTERVGDPAFSYNIIVFVFLCNYFYYI